MVSGHSSQQHTEGARKRAPVPVKIVISGGFGVGKTTLVAAISEIVPLTTEAAMTSVASRVDTLPEMSRKTTTTVAMDFGRITIDQSLILYIFGTPGQDRFGFMWDDIASGALGAVVLVDTRRLNDGFPAIDYFEKLGLPFVVGLNCFEGKRVHSLDEVRDALVVGENVPLVECDARSRESVKLVVLTLLELVLRRAQTRRV